MIRCLEALRRWWREPIPKPERPPPKPAPAPPRAPEYRAPESYTLEERIGYLESDMLALRGRVRALEDRMPAPGV
jgi:hypothetical protein